MLLLHQYPAHEQISRVRLEHFEKPSRRILKAAIGHEYDVVALTRSSTQHADQFVNACRRLTATIQRPSPAEKSAIFFDACFSSERTTVGDSPETAFNVLA